MYSLDLDLVAAPLDSWDYGPPVLIIDLKCTVSMIQAHFESPDLDLTFQGCCRSNLTAPLDSLHMISYRSPVLLKDLKRTVSMIQAHFE